MSHDAPFQTEQEAFWAGDRRYHYGDPSHVFEKVGIPGSLKALLKGMKTGSIDEKYLYEAPRPEYLEVEPRLRALARTLLEGTR